MPPPPPASAASAAAVPRPSASVILVSPANHILLLQRVAGASSFPAAHVFPGGNLSGFHDGAVPAPASPLRHLDGPTYRRAALRECFEECGVLLARPAAPARASARARAQTHLLPLGDAERELGRREVHADRVRFGAWVASKGGELDVEGLLPFTRWVTPPGVARRFTTQMYLYFLPTAAPDAAPDAAADAAAVAVAVAADAPRAIPVPTPDGGREHTTARFLPATAWLRLARQSRILLFPPQFLLLHHLATYLDAPPPGYAPTPPAPHAAADADAEADDVPVSRAEREARRERLRGFVTDSKATTWPAWKDKVICPAVVRGVPRRADGRVVLGLDGPGPELRGSGPRGEGELCLLVRREREGPRGLEVVGREAVGGGGRL